MTRHYPDFWKSLFAAAATTHNDVTLEEWWPPTAQANHTIGPTVAQATLAGASAPTLGHAFVGGYRCALEALLPNTIADDEIVSFAVSEAGGAHPRTIQTSLDTKSNLLNGKKTWSTLAPAASTLLVAASTGTDAEGRNQLRMLRVPVPAKGVYIEPREKTPFLPNVPHAVVTFEAAPVAPDLLLPGDGYLDYIKPFRTLEDLHVTASGVGYLFSWARRSTWPQELQEKLLGLAATALTLGSMPANDAHTHVALAGYLNLFREVLMAAGTEIQKEDQSAAADWNRDMVVFGVAGKAREARRLRAWEMLEASDCQ